MGLEFDMKTDIELKLLLVKMLPDKLYLHDNNTIYWKECNRQSHCLPVLETELLHLCWLAEQGLNLGEQEMFATTLYINCDVPAFMFELRDLGELFNMISITWQQRVTALATVFKMIEAEL